MIFILMCGQADKKLWEYRNVTWWFYLLRGCETEFIKRIQNIYFKLFFYVNKKNALLVYCFMLNNQYVKMEPNVNYWPLSLIKKITIKIMNSSFQ